jgi:hypothetical protein
MRSALALAPLLVLAATQARTDGASELARRLEAFRSPGPVAATLRLELILERTLHHKTARGEAAVSLRVDEDETGLRVRWEPRLLRDASAEERERDQASDRLSPVREAMTELDPARLGHLLDQVGTLAGLTRGAPIEDEAEVHEGREGRRLVYRFTPRLSWADVQYLRQSEGRFTLWIATDGTPLASESRATFEGKTSRTFGRFKGTTTVRTTYATEGGRLRVAKREHDELVSREDGGDVQQTVERFVLEPR